MLTIYVMPRGTLTYDGSINDLFRTVRVVGEAAVFVELSPGHLVNVAHIERVMEEQDDEQPCPHGFIRETCSRCSAISGRPDDPNLPPSGVR